MFEWIYKAVCRICFLLTKRWSFVVCTPNLCLLFTSLNAYIRYYFKWLFCYLVWIPLSLYTDYFLLPSDPAWSFGTVGNLLCRIPAGLGPPGPAHPVPLQGIIIGSYADPSLTGSSLKWILRYYTACSRFWLVFLRMLQYILVSKSTLTVPLILTIIMEMVRQITNYYRDHIRAILTRNMGIPKEP